MSVIREQTQREKTRTSAPVFFPFCVRKSTIGIKALPHVINANGRYLTCQVEYKALPWSQLLGQGSA